MINVFMGIRADSLSVSGGDVVQMLKTGAELSKLGCAVTYRYGEIGPHAGADLVHLFNTTRIDDTWRMQREVQATATPVVVSTIWHSMEEMRRAYGTIYGVRPFPIWAYTACKEPFYGWRSRRVFNPAAALCYKARVRYVMTTADALLPNSEAELRLLKEETGAIPKAAWAVPNGFDLKLGVRTLWVERDQIVCAGRVEPRKNQIGVVRAFQAAQLPREATLVLHGAITPQSRAYGDRVQRAIVGERASYGGVLGQEALYGVFGRSRVAVLASYFETTGLSALEGLAHGCSVVITDSPCTREYFGEAVEYCDPYSDESIARAIERAWRRPPPDVTALLARYNWVEAAKITLGVYERVLKQRKQL
jgi:glycosyltransferase involved in cell wall biosynthesis